MPQPRVGLLTQLIDALSEPQAGVDATKAGEQAGRQISLLGQVVITTAIILAGLTSFLGTRQIYEHLNQSTLTCLSLPAGNSRESPIEHSPIANKSISRKESLLLNQYEQSQELIAGLAKATPGQRLRLSQQLRILTHGLDDFCIIHSRFRAQQAGLLLVATWSASLATMLALLMAPQGLQNTSRTERTIFISTAFVLGISLSFLNFLDPDTNAIKAVASYTNYNRLLQSLSSSLANQQLLLLSPKSTQTAAAARQPLSSSSLVAELISNLDAALIAIPDPTITVNGNFARNAFTTILNTRDEPPAAGEAEAAAAAGSADRPAAARPSHPGPP